MITVPMLVTTHRNGEAATMNIVTQAILDLFREIVSFHIGRLGEKLFTKKIGSYQFFIEEAIYHNIQLPHLNRKSPEPLFTNR